MKAEIVAVGTELLLGQIVDTNSAWIAENLARVGIDSYFQTRVGDNPARIALVLRAALERGDAVVVCGGLGPTADDVTREAIAEVMGAPLVRDPDMERRIASFFADRGRVMAESNRRQADIPLGASFITQTEGTAPGLICPVGDRVVYAVPGVPHEMREMVRRAVIPDMLARFGVSGVIASRTLRTWGLAESSLAEVVASRMAALDEEARRAGEEGVGAAKIAFLASGVEGIKVRVTVKAADEASATAVLDAEEAKLRALLGDVVFGLDDESMEHAVARLLVQSGLTLGIAESVTGGLVASRLVGVPGASDWFRGAVVSYVAEVKRDLLGLPEGPVVTEAAARAMAEGARRSLGADVGLGITGVAGPASEEGLPVGTVWCALAGPGAAVEAARFQLPGDRERVRGFAAISALDMLRRRLLAPRTPAAP